MNHENNEQAWESFYSTGEIGKYLLYAALKRAGQEDERGK